MYCSSHCTIFQPVLIETGGRATEPPTQILPKIPDLPRNVLLEATIHGAFLETYLLVLSFWGQFHLWGLYSTWIEEGKEEGRGMMGSCEWEG